MSEPLIIDGREVVPWDDRHGHVGEITPVRFIVEPGAHVGLVLVVDDNGDRWRLLGPARVVKKWRDVPPEATGRAARRQRQKVAAVLWLERRGWPEDDKHDEQGGSDG